VGMLATKHTLASVDTSACQALGGAPGVTWGMHGYAAASRSSHNWKGTLYEVRAAWVLTQSARQGKAGLVGEWVGNPVKEGKQQHTWIMVTSQPHIHG
jgi:hypothetical protein